ncbi:cell division protein ZapE [Desertibaculum subflavum]|uniref:cell division protein ZapE n=1 Tax=Desertibaculum subflavum TaxID=2268458 RepID=UPI000E671E5E
MTTEPPIAAYRRLRKQGALKHDQAQELAAEKLDALHHQLTGYDPNATEGGWLGFFGLSRKKGEEPPQGLYIYGDVGRGKSMLMDLFFAGAPVQKKRRVHFHAFMQEVHREIFKFRREEKSQGDKGRNGNVNHDPIRPVAKGIAKSAWLLCFDEFQVTDVADAMILGRLFEKLFRRGVVVVATSNRPPDDLYAGGLNRQLFLPFIAMLKERLDVLELEGEQDYRLARLVGRPVYHTPLGRAAEAKLDEAFRDLTDGVEAGPDEIEVLGRKLVIPKAAKGAARASFDELCAAALGPADYLAIADRYHSLVLSGIPELGPARRNEAKRFVTLIDALYEAKVKLVCSAEVGPNEIYPAGDGSFEFHRTASRLMEMQSAEYWALPHKHVGPAA